VSLKAMAFGRPVIAFAAGRVPDIVEHDQNGLHVSAGNLGQLAQSLEYLLTNESFPLELGRRASAIVRSKDGFERFRSDLEALLRYWA
jgi:glycosyltransferase involved in cell wall biosynthesis